MSHFTVLITFWDIGHRVHEDGVRLLKENAVDVKVNPRTRFYTEQELIEAVRGIDGIFASATDGPFTRRVFDAADRLKIVTRNGVGYDNIDVEAATEKGVCVTLAPIPEHVKSVADGTFTLILSSLRRIPQLDRIARSGNWSGDRFVKFVHDACGKRLGIVGLGKIGTEVAKRARGFDMDVVYYDIVRKESLEKTLNVAYLSLEELLRTSDVVSINVALTSQTKHMIGEKELAMMKDGAFLVNTSRGAVIDEQALYHALRSGRLGGAGIDVMEREPPSPDNPLLKLENVVLTPHASASYEDARAMTMTNCEDMLRVFRGVIPKYLLNQDVLKRVQLREN
ncbi:MAG: phosphoglycerate dehydrogenase [Candidatus Bathyarchaeia archaeon]|jgi:lactate dehydrogenase-like 2-hydroxyacid dehydrogenase